MNKDKVIKDLKEKMLDNNDLWYYEPFINDLEKEIERLNNIINELEKHLQNEISNGRSEDNVWLMGCYDEDRKILDKLYELRSGE